MWRSHHLSAGTCWNLVCSLLPQQHQDQSRYPSLCDGNTQSHRIHHSHREEHRDKNFGAIFSLWDQLFGTQYRKYDEYPETGIDDATFPMKPNLLGVKR